jgi:hypothetical protein
VGDYLRPPGGQLAIAVPTVTETFTARLATAAMSSKLPVPSPRFGSNVVIADAPWMSSRRLANLNVRERKHRKTFATDDWKYVVRCLSLCVETYRIQN